MRHRLFRLLAEHADRSGQFEDPRHEEAWTFLPNLLTGSWAFLPFSAPGESAWPSILPFGLAPGASPSLAVNDVLLGQQWHLVNTSVGIDVARVWADYAGRGVRVGMIDDGFQYSHADLDGNYRQDLDRDFAARDSDAAPGSASNNHGTAVAGVIGAEANNGYGGTGVAWDSDLVGYRISFGTYSSTAEILEALRAIQPLDVVNNSWGYSGYFADNFATAAFAQHGLALEGAVRFGRGGLGTNIVFAAGNDRAAGQNVNYHDFQNAPHVITVAATGQTGAVTSFSTPGAAILVAAPGAGIVTTDRTGSAGYVAGDFASVSGTSFAAPIVSGVIALMLEANPALGYRDVQEILAYSAQKTAAFQPSLKTNGATDWNGGGLTFNHDVGFGLVDAHAAVRLAESWTVQSTYANAARLSAAAAPKLAIRDMQTVSHAITLGRADLEIDRVEVTVDLNHGRIGDLVLTLVSPSGTESLLVSRPGVSSSSAYGSTLNSIKFTMDSVHFWGEGTAGTWTLKVQDAAKGHTGSLNSWRLDFIGDAVGSSDLYVYTDAFALLGAQASRAVLRDSDGGTDTINLSAISNAVQLNLNPGANSTVLGRTLTIDSTTWIENAFTGDGNDTIIGNAGANRISGGRGADMISGGGGADVFVYARLADRGDVILDFGADDRFDLSGLFEEIGYSGGTPFSTGWAGSLAGTNGTALLIDPGGPAGGRAAMPLAFLQGYHGILGDYLIA